MLIHPQFDPVAVSLPIRWYGLMYVLAFVFFAYLSKRRFKQGLSPFKTALEVDDLLFYGILGVILGGRLGYILFYASHHYFGRGLAGLVDILRVWEGGMSFHGGLLGVIIAMFLFCRKYGQHFLAITDFIAPMSALGLFFGRVGNFINGELWGRVSTGQWPWLMGFPQAYHQDVRWLAQHAPSADLLPSPPLPLPRHPSQVYEMMGEGLLLFLFLWWYSKKSRPLGHVSAYFLILYAIARFTIECFREPDGHLSDLPLGLTMGQWLSIPMFILGIYLRCRKPTSSP